jgi:hypothetical protein
VRHEAWITDGHRRKRIDVSRIELTFEYSDVQRLLLGLVSDLPQMRHLAILAAGVPAGCGNAILNRLAGSQKRIDDAVNSFLQLEDNDDPRIEQLIETHRVRAASHLKDWWF